MTYNIINEPEEAKNYEFIVVKPIDYVAESYLFMGMYKDGFEALQVARRNDAIIIHNVRAHGYKEPPKERHYTFSGAWVWDCCAKSKEEAIAKWEEAYAEEYELRDYDSILID